MKLTTNYITLPLTALNLALYTKNSRKYAIAYLPRYWLMAHTLQSINRLGRLALGFVAARTNRNPFPFNVCQFAVELAKHFGGAFPNGNSGNYLPITKESKTAERNVFAKRNNGPLRSASLYVLF